MRKICPICGSDGVLDEDCRDYLGLKTNRNSFQIYKCKKCDLRWLDPYLDESELVNLYGKDYFDESQGECSAYSSDIHERRECFYQAASNFKDWGINSGLLDIGCGTGEFLKAAKEIGIDAKGIELSSHAAEYARRSGLDIERGTIFDLNGDQQVKAVHCSHVLEHVPDAGDFMRKMYEILEPESPLYLEVPIQFYGVLDWINRARGRTNTFSLYSIHHHYLFSKKSIELLLKNNGFEVISIKTFMKCRRQGRKSSLRKALIQVALYLADKLLGRGDVISIWAIRKP